MAASFSGLFFEKHTSVVLGENNVSLVWGSLLGSDDIGILSQVGGSKMWVV